jgi:hypothetical protein
MFFVPNMIPNKKFAVSAFLLVTTFAGIGTTFQPGEGDKPTTHNLKVIPKSISGENLEILMNRYSREVGAQCNYCHVIEKSGLNVTRMDFATDEKPEKKIAREMMKMMNKINQKYFGVKNTYDVLLKLPVSCKTCHRGLTRPDKSKIYFEK